MVRALKREAREAFEQSRVRLSIREKNYDSEDVVFEDVYDYNRS